MRAFTTWGYIGAGLAVIIIAVVVFVLQHGTWTASGIPKLIIGLIVALSIIAKGIANLRRKKQAQGEPQK
jgi:uncharacterized membrane protein